MSGRRTERLSQEIREAVAGIVGQLKDPRIGFITITRVELTADLGSAKIYVGILGDDAQRHRSLTGLRAAAGFVRRELGRRIKIRHTPDVLFEYDKGLDATDRVARLLNGLKSEAEPSDS